MLDKFIPWWVKWLIIAGAIIGVAILVRSWYGDFIEGVKGEGRAEVQAKWDADKIAARDAAAAERNANDRKRTILEAQAAADFARRQFEIAKGAAVEADLQKVLESERAALRACTIGGSLAGVFNRAAGIRIPGDRGTDADRAANVQPPDQTRRVDGEEFARKAVKNTDAARQMFCGMRADQRYCIKLWEAHEKRTYPTAQLAPWLLDETEEGVCQ